MYVKLLEKYLLHKKVLSNIVYYYHYYYYHRHPPLHSTGSSEETLIRMFLRTLVIQAAFPTALVWVFLPS